MIKNKIRPGAYIDFQSKSSSLGKISDRGITLLPLELDFLPEKQVITTNIYTDFLTEFGVSILDNALLPVKEALKNSETVLIYRVNSGVCASKTIGTMTAKAMCSGTYGNKISFQIVKNSTYTISTFVDDILVDIQEVASFDDFKNNNIIEFSGTIQTTGKTSLLGGISKIATKDEYLQCFEQFSKIEFNTIGLMSTDIQIKSAFVMFVKNMRENEGKKIQGVIANYDNADFEGIINVANGVILNDGTEIPANIASCYVAGAVAGASINESLTHSIYIDAYDTLEKFSSTEIITALKEGKFIFTAKRGKVVIEQDINTFTSFSSEKSNVFAKNRVVRVLDSIASDIKIIFEDYYLGKISNNEQGRALFLAECVRYLRNLEDINAIDTFNPLEDIEISIGEDIDSIYVSLNICPVDSIEKLYMTVILN